MVTEALSHLIQRIRTTPVQTNPYFHFHTELCFPEEFYQDLIDNIPDTSYFSSLEDYPQRFILDLVAEKLNQLPFTNLLFWQQFTSAVCGERFARSLLEKFQSPLKEQFGDDFQKKKLGTTASIIRDQSGYSIGPHTDHPNKIISLLFYLPISSDQRHLGTSIYLPKDRTFKCKGREHHSFKDFDKVSTAPFIPNSIFCFLRSDVSFHGVEPVCEKEKERVLLCYNIWEEP
jgi:hypothetical protein